jgi:hypothetical protein
LKNNDSTGFTAFRDRIETSHITFRPGPKGGAANKRFRYIPKRYRPGTFGCRFPDCGAPRVGVFENSGPFSLKKTQGWRRRMCLVPALSAVVFLTVRCRVPEFLKTPGRFL